MCILVRSCPINLHFKLLNQITSKIHKDTKSSTGKFIFRLFSIIRRRFFFSNFHGFSHRNLLVHKSLQIAINIVSLGCLRRETVFTQEADAIYLGKLLKSLTTHRTENCYQIVLIISKSESNHSILI